MEIASLVLNVLIFLLLGVEIFFRSYLGEKGKNLATKEDIEEITHKIEGVKTEFFEHQTRYSSLHQKRFEVMGRTFELLHDPHEYIIHMVSPHQDNSDRGEAQRQKQASDAFNELSGYYWQHKIYLPEDLCEGLETILRTMQDVFAKYKLSLKHPVNERALELSGEAYETMKSEVPALRSELEKQFRENVTVQRDVSDA